MRLQTLFAPALLASALLLAACGEEAPSIDQAAGPLAFAPADTPYVFGMLEPMSDELVDRFMQRSNRFGDLYAAQFAQLREAMAKKQGDANLSRFVDALASEFQGKSLTESLALFGIDGHQRMALYGIGLDPVLRLELADPAALPALVSRLEAKIGDKLPSAKIGEQAYWAIDFGEKDAPLMLLAAVVGNQLVLTAAPNHPDAATLNTLLGLTPPEHSILDGERLQALQQRHHYLPVMLGEIDSQRLLDTLAKPATPLETAFLQALAIDKPTISAECQSEYSKLAGLMPRISVGYTRLDAEHMDMTTLIETGPAVSTALKTLRAPMPGMGAVAGSVMNIGYSIKLASIPPLAGQFAQAVNAAPFTCASLTWLNDAAKQAPQLGNNPGIYAAAPVFSGFHAILDELSLDADLQPSALKGSILIGSDNPQSLLGMAKNFVPQLASLEVKTDGSVQKLDLPPIPDLDMPQPAWVSAKGKVLGIGFGEGADVELPTRLQSDPAEQPLLVMGYDGALYAQLMKTVMDKAATGAKTDAERQSLQQTAAVLDEIYGQWIQHFGLRIEITDAGIAIEQNIVSAPE